MVWYGVFTSNFNVGKVYMMDRFLTKEEAHAHATKLRLVWAEDMRVTPQFFYVQEIEMPE